MQTRVWRAEAPAELPLPVGLRRPAGAPRAGWDWRGSRGSFAVLDTPRAEQVISPIPAAVVEFGRHASLRG